MDWFGIYFEGRASRLADELAVGCERMGTEASWLKLSLCTQAASSWWGRLLRWEKLVEDQVL